jgi:outer membrane lipoprotein-sorting protein
MKKSTRWITAAAVPVAVIAAGVVVPAVSANAEVSLPDKSPQQILAMVADSSDAAFSGTVEQTSDLGLPELPSGAQGTGSGDSVAQALELLTGSHTAQVFVDGVTKQRVQVVEDLAERDVVRDGDSVWAWDSSTKEATHVALPAHDDHELPTSLPDGTAVPQTPADLADALVAAVEPSTTVTTSDDVSVAGREAYQVVLTPDDPSTLVGSATLTVDAETGVPLKVVVTAAGQADPAFSVGFTDVDFSTPASDVFEFSAPAGADVTEATPPADGAPAGGHGADSTGDPAQRPTVVGSGWSTVVGLPAPTGDVPATADATDGAADATALLDQVTTAVDGGRVLQTSLVSVWLADDGRVWVGAVDADALRAAAAGR